MKKYYLIIPALFLTINIHSQVPFDLNPNWTSTGVNDVSTGGAFADINQDGWLDFIVANGNDISLQNLVVYYNTTDGAFPLTPDWQAADFDYHGHLDVGDVNSDGYPDVAVSVYIGQSGFNSPGKVKLYLNNNGTLSSTPDWVSGDLVYTFSCAFGDADNDGDLDLAVAAGESYYSAAEQPRVYYNNGGMLETLPSWKGNTPQYSYDVEWADFDNDGDLDLVFNGEGNPNKIFENINGIISTSPVWQSTDASKYANSLYVGDVNNDGFLDLAISDNNQLGGAGKFKIYLNNNGVMSPTPFWTSNFSGYGSGILLADINNDFDPDLITGGWWNPMRIYLNDGGSFSPNPEYISTSSSVVEVIVAGDIDKDVVSDIRQIITSDGTKKLFYMPHTQLQTLQRVIVNSDTLLLNEYCFDLDNGWISLSSQPDSGALILAEAIVSRDLDLGITNWDQNKGNFLFYNNSIFVHTEDKINSLEYFTLLQNYPNPFNSSTKIKFTIPTPSLSSPLSNGRNEARFVTLKVYDILGREVTTLVNEEKPAGEYEVEFNAASGIWDLVSGIYFYQLQAGDPSTGSGQVYLETKKMILMK
jgi:hypothetical protein